MMGRRKWIALAMAVLLVTPLAVWASDRFEDVPDSNVFHDDIAWLADSGVTFGCNPPENSRFCPDDNVTREQMAAFMRRLSEGQVVDAATAIQADSATEADYAASADSATEADHAAEADHANTAEDANTLDTFSSEELASRAAFAFDDGLPNTNTTLDTTIEAPVRGSLVINAGVDVFGGADTVICELLVDGTVVAGSRRFSHSADGEDDCATTGAVVVDPGSHAVTFNIRGVATASLDDGSLNVIWVPFDGSGATPVSVAGQSNSSDQGTSSHD